MANGVLHLVRHGESAGNVDPSLPRSGDPPLTERGREQAARAAAALARGRVDAVLSSPLRRARETAGAIAAVAGVGVELAPGFREVDMGALADAESSEGRAERDAIFTAWLSGDHRRAFPGGEDFGAVMRRVEAALRTICSASPAPRDVVVVSHRMAIAAAAALALGTGRAALPGRCANGSVTTLRARDGGGWELVAWADARHLAGCDM